VCCLFNWFWSSRDGRSLQLAAARAAAAGARNVAVLHGRIETLAPEVHVDIVIAMHACGVASDWAQIQVRLFFSLSCLPNPTQPTYQLTNQTQIYQSAQKQNEMFFSK
jgi:hypothetical protein